MAGRQRKINLEKMPWPVSVLKFNRAVSEMKPGDKIIAFIRDADVIANLLKLLRGRGGVGVTVSSFDGEFCFEVRKKEGVTDGGAANGNQENG